MKIQKPDFAATPLRRPREGRDPGFGTQALLALAKPLQRAFSALVCTIGLLRKTRFCGFPFHAAVNTASSQPANEAGICAVNEAFDPDQEWIELRYGVYPNERGLQVVDRASAEAMVTAFNSLPDRAVRGFRGLPILVGHPDDAAWLAAHPGATAEAVGRVRELRVADTGLQLRRALNETGRRLLSGEAAPFDAFSPNWLMAPISYQGRKAFRPVILKSIGLTNQPNIPGTRIALNEALPAATTEAAENMKLTDAVRKLLAALGKTVAADATDDQLVVAANEAEPTATAAISAQTELATTKTNLVAAQNEATTAKNDAATLRTQLSEKTTAAVNERAARAKLIVGSAVKEGRIIEAKRGEFETRLVGAANDTAFAAIETEIGALKPAVNTSAKSTGIGARRGGNAASASKISAINEAVQKHMKETGATHAVAYAAVRSAQPALFEATNAAA